MNQRLADLGVAGKPLVLADNLNYHEQRFMLALFEGAPRRALLRAYVRLARALLADDLYHPLRKGGGLAAFATSMFLPARTRPACLTRLLYAPGPRRWLRPLKTRFSSSGRDTTERSP